MDRPESPPPVEILRWHVFDTPSSSWTRLPAVDRSVSSETASPGPASQDSLRLSLVTWNIDAFGPEHEARMSGILSMVRARPTAPDVVFFQEVSRQAMRHLAQDGWVRDNYYSCEVDAKYWAEAPFMTVTLLSRHTFGPSRDDPTRAALGAVWRIRYESRYGRDALCCEIAPPSTGSGSGPGVRHVCLVNVHLDSLSDRPSLRPPQLGCVAATLRATGRGLVAGDFNPTLPDDDALVEKNGLVDVWTELRPEEDGLTWGVGVKTPYPARRFDKIAVLGMRGVEIDTLEPGCIESSASEQSDEDDSGNEWSDGTVTPLPWSDHFGLRCSLELSYVDSKLGTLLKK